MFSRKSTPDETPAASDDEASDDDESDEDPSTKTPPPPPKRIAATLRANPTLRGARAGGGGVGLTRRGPAFRTARGDPTTAA